MEKVKIGNTYGYSNFITNEEQKILLNWIFENHNNFRENGYGRKFGVVYDFENYPNLIYILRERIVKIENIQNFLEEPCFRDYVGINTEGGQIHYHTDPNKDDYVHTRYNIVLSYPESGGESIYDGVINKLYEKLIWKCIAGKIFHGSTVVVGKKPRITLSLGFLIREN